MSVYTVADNKFARSFGFTNEEVKELLDYYGASERFEDAKSWYDGFRVGKLDLFSPWDIVSYARNLKTTACLIQPVMRL